MTPKIVRSRTLHKTRTSLTMKLAMILKSRMIPTRKALSHSKGGVQIALRSLESKMSRRKAKTTQNRPSRTSTRIRSSRSNHRMTRSRYFTKRTKRIKVLIKKVLRKRMTPMIK